MRQNQTFAELLASHIQHDGRHVRQLAQAITTLFGSVHQVPHNTISRWLRGTVRKPRNWPDIVKLAAALQLAPDDLHQILYSAGYDGPSLLAAEPPIDGLFDFWQRPSRRPVPFQAPPQLPAFIGRTELVAQLTRYFSSQVQARVSCLVGMAGLGKTSLATHLAYQLKDKFSDGILWITLNQTEPMSALQGIAQAYAHDVSAYSDLSTRSSKVRELLATKNALLILDNAEDDDQLRPLMPPDGRCAVLITSRRHDLTLTDQAHRCHLSPFNRDKAESLTLFRRRLGDKTVQLQADLYQQIADQLGHLPLAVNIIAQRLRHEPDWTATDMLHRLQEAQQRLALLRRGSQQVRLSFATTFALLEPADQQLFALLGLFPGTFTAASVAQIGQRPLWDTQDSLRHLYSLSLLQTTGDRYHLHPLLRDFSQEQPQDANWLSQFVHTFSSGTETEAESVAERHNIITAIHLAYQLQMDEAAVTAVTHLYPYLQKHGQLDQAVTLLRLGEQAARRSQNSYGLIRILNHSGYTAMKQGQPDQATSYYQEALALAQQTKDTQQTADLLLKLGALAYRRSRLEEAHQFYTEALALARQLGNVRLIASLLTNLGLVEAAHGGLDKAIAHYQEALTLVNQDEEPGLIINILQNLGNMLEERGDYAQAQGYLEDGLKLAEQLRDPELRSRMLGNLGAIACHLGNYAEATAYFRQGLTLAEANGLPIQIYRQQANLGQAAMLRGQTRQANIHYQEAIRLVRQLGFPEDIGMILNQAGESYLTQDDYQKAAHCFLEAKQLADESQLLRVGPLSLYGLARVAAARGNMVEAYRLGEQSRQQLLAAGHRKANEVWWWLQELPTVSLPT
ncbi:MAG: tetratricopeptide repeat protein [Ardenticatenaceae bacterium]|nr:tetratricopeptide repeat protein [Ardenticatenaceae bacterium]